MITSSSNDFIKHLKKLQTKKSYRHENKEFVLEGIKPVTDGIEFVKTVIAGESFDADKIPANVPVQIVSDKIIKEISDTQSPQGIMALCRMPDVDVKEISTENSVIVFCDNVSDPGNLGTIIRTADAAGCDGVVLSGCADLYNPKTVRSTMSSLFNIKINICDDGIKTLEYFKNNFMKITGTSPRAENLLYKTDFTGSEVIVIGNEANGISERVLTICDKCVKIPMFGKAESLNASVAAALVIYDAVMQRNADK